VGKPISGRTRSKKETRYQEEDQKFRREVDQRAANEAKKRGKIVAARQTEDPVSQEHQSTHPDGSVSQTTDRQTSQAKIVPTDVVESSIVLSDMDIEFFSCISHIGLYDSQSSCYL